jgi:hypothetical protein
VANTQQVGRGSVITVLGAPVSASVDGSTVGVIYQSTSSNIVALHMTLRAQSPAGQDGTSEIAQVMAVKSPFDPGSASNVTILGQVTSNPAVATTVFGATVNGSNLLCLTADTTTHGFGRVIVYSVTEFDTSQV